MATVILLGVAVITACTVNFKFDDTADGAGSVPVAASSAPEILGGVEDGAKLEYTGKSQKIVTDLPAGMRYAISTEYVDPDEIDTSKIVPTEYTALDYLQGTGTQYINTGFLTDAGIMTKCAVRCLDYTYEGARSYNGAYIVGGWELFGSDENFNKSHYVVNGVGWRRDGPWKLGCGVASSGQYAYDEKELYDLSSKLVCGQKYTIDASTVDGHIYLKLDDSSPILSSDARPRYSKPLAIYLWDRTDNDTHTGFGTAKADLYYAIIYDQYGILQRDFVPVREDSTGTLGMYDVCNDKFYTNDGTGDFASGEEVNTAAKNLAFLKDINDPRNEQVLNGDTKYYVYYYTQRGDTTTAGQISVKEFTVQCENHDYDEWQEISEATCTETGEREHTCQICGHVDRETIPTLEHSFGKWVTVETTLEAVRQRRECERGCGTVEERELFPYLHQITIRSESPDNLRLTVTIYSGQGQPFTLSDFVRYLNGDNDFVYSGTVRYYNPNTKMWYETTVTRIAKVDNSTFAFYYLKDDMLVKVVTTLSHLTITDEVSLWATVEGE